MQARPILSHLFALTLAAALASAACSPEEPGAATETRSADLVGTPVGDTLVPGQTLASRQSLFINGYELVMQWDCNLVLYDLKDQNDCDVSPFYQVLWASGTDGRGGADTCRATMQTDGNFVVYTGGQALWASGTNGNANGGSLVLQGDGNAVIYVGTSARWATGTDVNPGPRTRTCHTPTTGGVDGRLWNPYFGGQCGTTQFQVTNADGSKQLAPVSPVITGSPVIDADGRQKCKWEFDGGISTWGSVPAGQIRVYGLFGGRWFFNIGNVTGGLTTVVDINRNL
jgi:hypothetical protein